MACIQMATKHNEEHSLAAQPSPRELLDAAGYCWLSCAPLNSLRAAPGTRQVLESSILSTSPWMIATTQTRPP